MKRILKVLLALMVMLTFTAAGEASAKWVRNKKETRKPNVQRLDWMPTMGFYTGTLRSGSHGQWDLDGTPVGLSSDCRIWEAGSPTAQLQSGSTVVLMGQKVSGGIIARQVVVQAPHFELQGSNQKDPSVIWSDTDPTVGEGGPPESGSN